MTFDEWYMHPDTHLLPNDSYMMARSAWDASRCECEAKLREAERELALWRSLAAGSNEV